MTHVTRRGFPSLLLALLIAGVGVGIWWLRSISDANREIRSPQSPAHEQFTRWVAAGDAASPELLASLRGGAGPERRFALAAVGSLRQVSPEIRDAVREILTADHPPDRREALLAWVATSRLPGDCLPELRVACLDSDPVTRSTAFDLLGDLGTDAEPVLAELATTMTDPQRESALRGLLAVKANSPPALAAARLAWQPDQPRPCQLAGLELLIQSGHATPQLLRPALTDPARDLQELGLVGVRELGPAAAELQPELAQVNWATLLETRHRQALTGSIRQLPITILNPNPAVAMAGVNQGEAVFPEFDELPNASPETRFSGEVAVLGALAAIGPAARNLAPRVAETFASAGPRQFVQAAWCQSKLGVPSEQLEPELLTRLLADPPLGAPYAELLAHWNSPRLPQVVAALKETRQQTDPERASAWWRCVAKLGPAAAGLMSELCQELDRFDRNSGTEVFRVIEGLGAEAQPLLPRLLEMVGGPDPVRQNAALTTLTRLGPVARTAEPLLLGILEADLATLPPLEEAPEDESSGRGSRRRSPSPATPSSGTLEDGASRLLKVGIPASPGQRVRQQAAAALAAIEPAAYAPLEPLLRYLEPGAVESPMQAFVLEALWNAATLAGREVELARLAWETGDETVRRRLCPLLERAGGDRVGRQQLVREWLADWPRRGVVKRRSLESLAGDLTYPDPQVRVELDTWRTLGQIDHGPEARQLLEHRRDSLRQLFPDSEPQANSQALPRGNPRDWLRARRDLLKEIALALNGGAAGQASPSPARPLPAQP
ncbi:MAG: hypothetical protein ACKOGA_16295 [Planctomycetaceae bacterium]